MKKANILHNDKVIVAQLIDFPMVITEGNNVEELKLNLNDALSLAIGKRKMQAHNLKHNYFKLVFKELDQYFKD